MGSRYYFWNNIQTYPNIS